MTADSPTTSSSFCLPPTLRNARGDVRRVGFEFEFSGVSIERSAELVRDVFGGRIEVSSTFVQHVHTDHGRFSVEIDTALLKDKRYEQPMRSIGLKPESLDMPAIERMLLDVLSSVVPIEIGGPPLPLTDLARMEELRARLLNAGAKGTRASVAYAFGMHINPEIPSEDPAVIRDHLRAFLLLYPWLQERTAVDLTRRITPYVNAFPSDYARLILAPDYPDALPQLIDDYLDHNPTRNRPLDMLPVLASLDEQRVMARARDPHLVKGRPAFHYRMPNCDLDNPDWTLAREWNAWVVVERLASDPDRLAEMSRQYLEADESSFRPFYDKWPELLAVQIG